MVLYMNRYFKHSRDTSVKAKNYKLEAKMLKKKIANGNKEAGQRVNAATKRAKDDEAALQRAMEENSRIKDI